jgi:hypothetical protein
MSILSAPNTHKPHWSDQLIVLIRKLTTIITYTKQEKDIRYLREDDIKEDIDLAVSLEDFLKQPPVRFSITALVHLPPFLVPPRDNTRTENLILS